MMTKKIGLVGIGLVGTAMAESLLKAGFEVVGFDIDPTRCSEFEKLGGKSVINPAKVASQVEYLVLSLPDTKVVKQVIESPDGVLKAEPLPKHIIAVKPTILSSTWPTMRLGLGSSSARGSIDHLHSLCST